jgi:hypothetical protein
VESAHQRARVLRAALDNSPLSPPLLGDILLAVESIGSDSEKAGLLETIAGRGLVTDELRPAFRRAFETIESRSGRNRVLAALGRRAI